MKYSDLKLNQKVQLNYNNGKEVGYVCYLWDADKFNPAGGRVEVVEKNGFAKRVEFKDYDVGDFVTEIK